MRQVARLARKGRDGSRTSQPDVWFWLTCSFPGRDVQKALGQGELTAHELAQALGRSRRSVRRAIQAGHFRRVGHLPKRGIIVHVTAEQQEAWRGKTPMEAWALASHNNPTLPSWGVCWFSVDELTRTCRLNRDVIRARLRAVRAPMIEWDFDTPFLTQRRFYVPDLAVLLRSVGRSDANAMRTKRLQRP